jgi:D-sedoheptulose 7-phosphate isomerase
MKNIIKNEFDCHLQTAKLLDNLIPDVENCAQICIRSLKNGGKILLFGNGGSAADAQHIAAELIGRFKIERNGLPAIALTTDSSVITSISNDYGYQHVFSRQVGALAKSGDVVIAISTSGKSENITNAVNLATKLKCKTIGFSGNDGGLMNNICELNIVIPSDDTPRIQEMHILIGHTICHLIDQAFND